MLADAEVEITPAELAGAKLPGAGDERHRRRGEVG